MTFQSRVYSLCKQVPAGKITTYKAIADTLGSKGYRAVGNALNKNPDLKTIPCHRVVNKVGRLALGYAFGGPGEQKMRLLSEGVVFVDENHVDLQKCQITQCGHMMISK